MHSITSTTPLAPNQLLATAGYPAGWAIQGDVSTSVRDVRGGKAYSYRFAARPQSLDLPALYAASRVRKLRPLAPRKTSRGAVLLFSDLQVGKTDHRGGTAELIARLARIRAELGARLKTRPVDRILLADLGDGIESFSNTAGQAFTNDRSLPEQLDIYATELYEMVKLAARHAPVDVTVVPSNHSAWRAGKQALGRPGDDFGLTVHHLVQRATDAARLPVKFHAPDVWEEALAVDFMGTLVGMHHGHQAASGRFGAWVAKQVAGGGALAECELILSGHFHTLVQEQIGRLTNGRARWHVQATCTDNGSSWWRNGSGVGDSDAGLTVLEVARRGGFQVGSVDVLYGDSVTAHR